MKRTSAGLLIGAAFLGAIVGFGVDQVLTSMGRASITPAYSLSILFGFLALAVLALAWPIRRAVRATPARRIDPFRATRIAVLARASSLLGALTGGGALGLLLFVSTRGTAAPVGSLTAIGVTIAASVVLLVAALIAEKFCTLPKDDDDQPDGTDAAGTTRAA